MPATLPAAPAADKPKRLIEQVVIALKLRDDAADLGASKDDGELGRAADAFDAGDVIQLPVEDLLVEEEQGGERLILSGSSDVCLDGEVAEELRDFFFPHLGGVAFLVEKDEAADPVGVGFFGADAVALDSEVPADAVEELGGRGGCRPWWSGGECSHGGDASGWRAEKARREWLMGDC